MDIVKIEKSAGRNGTLSLPPALYRNHIEKVSFSSKNMPCQCAETAEDVGSLSEDLWETLHIPFPINIHTFAEGDTLHLYPLIGIMTTSYMEGSMRPFGKRTEEFRKLLKFAEHQGGLAFLFTPDQVDWENGLITGVFYKDSKWTECDVPFPHVIYDRIPTRRAEKLTKVKAVKNRLMNDYAIPWFNPGFFNKWEIHQLLSNHPVSMQYLPKTYDFEYNTLRKGLDLFKTIYVKPKNSSHGIGIKRIEKTTDGYICQENTIEKTEENRYASLEDLINHEFSESHPNHYLLQQGLKLPTYHDRPFDFRVHTNKDGNGEWQISAAAVKVAGTNRLTTHTAYGGDIKTLKSIYGETDCTGHLNVLKDIAVTLSEVIDQQIDGLVGELGLDLVIDVDGRVWLLEANAKPGPIIFSLPAIRKQQWLVYRYWFDYCTYLAKLGIQKPDWLLTSV